MLNLMSRRNHLFSVNYIIHVALSSSHPHDPLILTQHLAQHLVQQHLYPLYYMLIPTSLLSSRLSVLRVLSSFATYVLLVQYRFCHWMLYCLYCISYVTIYDLTTQLCDLILPCWHMIGV